jgi:hypothetical protein
MTQPDLYRAVAQATGESVHTIDARGFVLLTMVPFELERTVDWDSLDDERVVLFGEGQ